jgi:hypothetical protein
MPKPAKEDPEKESGTLIKVKMLDGSIRETRCDTSAETVKQLKLKVSDKILTLSIDI